MNEPRGLGRVPSPPDPRDANYPARQLLRTAEPERRYRRWYADALWLDQGPIGQCTAVSLAHILADGPFTHRPYWTDKPLFDTVAAYCRAQTLDGQPRTFCEGGPDTGATMRSAAEAGRELGLVANYWWFATPDEALAYLTNQGPLWMGTWWTTGMDEPGPDGFIRFSGGRLGGHAWKIDEISWRLRFVGMKQNWGREWNGNGRARLSFEDFAALLADEGECLAITEQRVGA